MEEIGKAIEPADETNVSEDNDADKDDSKEDNDASDNPQSVTREINFERYISFALINTILYLVETALMHILKIDRDRDDNSIAYLQFKGPNYDRMRMYGGYDLESHDYAVTMGLGVLRGTSVMSRAWIQGLLVNDCEDIWKGLDCKIKLMNIQVSMAVRFGI